METNKHQLEVLEIPRRIMDLMCNEIDLERLPAGDVVEDVLALPTVDRVCKPANADDGQFLPGNQECMHLNTDY
jgi:hypothetical protein